MEFSSIADGTENYYQHFENCSAGAIESKHYPGTYPMTEQFVNTYIHQRTCKKYQQQLYSLYSKLTTI